MATSAHSVVYGIDKMYQHAHRGRGIGGWQVLDFKPGYAEIDKTTPCHCIMEEGILLAALAAVGVPSRIEQRQCFRQGAPSCLFVVTSVITDFIAGPASRCPPDCNFRSPRPLPRGAISYESDGHDARPDDGLPADAHAFAAASAPVLPREVVSRGARRDPSPIDLGFRLRARRQAGPRIAAPRVGAWRPRGHAGAWNHHPAPSRRTSPRR